MARKRLTMRKIREVLRLRWQQRRSVRETARALGVSTGVVAKLTHRAKLAGLSWERVEQLNDDALEKLLYGSPAKLGTSRAEPDPVWIDTELRKPGVSLVLLHLEYLQEHPKGFKYTAFCNRYRKWKEKRGVTMRQVHKAGEKMFVDYSGKKPSVVDRNTGEARSVELFVAVLGASNMTYATATETQQSDDWIAAHSNALEFFGGAARITVPDQLRSAISKPSRYEPAIQQTYAKWAQHYGTVVIPARPYKARDKAKVEVAVQVAQRWILRLRHDTFFSLGALNARIAELVDELNRRPMKKRGGMSRLELFDRLDRPVLQALPQQRFEPCEWRRARVGDDYHVLIADRYYSVPCALVREEVEVRITKRSSSMVDASHRTRAEPATSTRRRTRHTVHRTTRHGRT